MYTPLYKPNQLILGDGQLIVITGWTPKEYVAKQLRRFAAVGNLYSPARGIDLLVRNLLANPGYTNVALLGITKEDANAGSVDALEHFFRHGVVLGKNAVGKQCWVVESSVRGYIDRIIPLAVLNDLRQRCNVVRYANIADINSHIPKDAVLRLPLTYPLQTTTHNVLPNYIYGHRIEGKTIAEAWVKLLHRIRTGGIIRPNGYDGEWQELIDLVAVVTDEPRGFHFEDWLPVSPEFMQTYRKHMCNDAPVVPGVKYSYGQRMRSHFGIDQVQTCIDKLKREPDSASAVISLWDVNDHERGGSPCLNHVWLRIVDGKLTMTATFRSNDMFGAWVSNAMGLRALQELVADAIDCEIGALITVSQSAHIYDDCWENADALIQKYYGRRKQSYDDPCGNFTIEYKDVVVVTQTALDGSEVASYTGVNALRLLRDICKANPTIQPEHIGYIGYELHKVFTLTAAYRQDD
jgi:thymidylate synthase